MKIGIVHFGFPAIYNRQNGGKSDNGKIGAFLHENGFAFCEISVSSVQEFENAVTVLRLEAAECLIVYLRHWSRTALVVQLIRKLNLPTALYAKTSGGDNGITALTAVSAVLREVPSGRMIDGHRRFYEGMEAALLDWLHAAAAYQHLRASRLLMWGGPYGAEIPYTRSDPDFLESRFIAEIMTEQENTLTNRAEKILRTEPERIGEFRRWMVSCGLKIHFDNIMVTEESISKQIALYLAARDRLKELRDEHICGVSLKCHFELSITEWGCTGCLLPAFLPYGAGPNGEQDVVPVACEGDLNGLAGLAVLHALNRNVPPLFGDFVQYTDDFILLRNCGASSVYWAALSGKPEECLSNTELYPNIHGKSGAAVHYETPCAEVITLCRIARVHGKFYLFYGKGRIIPESESSRYPDPWPHTRLAFETDHASIFSFFPCNHASITAGDYTERLKHFCRLAGFIPVDIGSKREIEAFEINLLDP